MVGGEWGRKRKRLGLGAIEESENLRRHQRPKYHSLVGAVRVSGHAGKPATQQGRHTGQAPHGDVQRCLLQSHQNSGRGFLQVLLGTGDEIDQPFVALARRLSPDGKTMVCPYHGLGFRRCGNRSGAFLGQTHAC